MIKVGIIAGEISGDILAAGLIRSFKETYADAEFVGIAGPLMQSEGCTSLFPMEKLSVMGIVEILSSYYELKRIQDSIVDYFISNPPDVFIGVDAPDFNITVSNKLKKQGIKTVQYVSPSVWAWRQYRVNKIVSSVGLMLTLFPFEKQFYDNYDIQVEFVGHTLADTIPLDTDMVDARKELGLDKLLQLEGSTLVALLPGSRLSEVKKLSQPFLDTVVECQKRDPKLLFIIPYIGKEHRKIIEEKMKTYVASPQVILIEGKSRLAMTASNAVLLASGTASLEALLLKKPMLVSYKISPITYWIVKKLAKVPYFSLPNLLSGEKIVEELVQEEVNASNMTPKIFGLLDSEQWKDKIEIFSDIHLMLRKDANHIAAQAVIKYINS